MTKASIPTLEATLSGLDLFTGAATRGMDYLRQIEERRVAPEPAALADLRRLGGPLPAASEKPERVLALLDEAGSPATIASNAGRYFGFVTGAALPVCVAAEWLATAWNQNAALRIMSPVAATLEDVALGWLAELFELPASYGGTLVTCATTANLAGIAAARHALLARAGWDVEAAGLFGAPPIKVVLGAEAHVSVRKSLGILGLGRERVIVAPSDTQGRMRTAELPPLDERTIVIAQAGNVNTGACDDLQAICEAAKRGGAWVHVDGAFGLWARVAPERARLVRGLELADSCATDAHKWLNVPYDSGIAFVRDREALAAAMAATAAYLPTADEREPMHYTPDSSRRARAVALWAAIKCMGRSGIAGLVEQTCSHAQVFADRLSRAGYTVLNDVVLNQVLVSFGSSETTSAVIRAVQEDGTCWCGGTEWQGRTAMRISVSSHKTTSQDVERSARAMISIVDRISGRQSAEAARGQT